MSLSGIRSFRSSVAGAGKPSGAAVKNAQGTLRTALAQGRTAQHPSVQNAVQTLKSAGQMPQLTPGQSGIANK